MLPSGPPGKPLVTQMVTSQCTCWRTCLVNRRSRVWIPVVPDSWLQHIIVNSLVVQRAKNLSAIQETQVWSLCWEDPVEKGMAYSSILAWRIPWTGELGGLESMGSQRVGYDWVINTFTSLSQDVTLFFLQRAQSLH